MSILKCQGGKRGISSRQKTLMSYTCVQIKGMSACLACCFSFSLNPFLHQISLVMRAMFSFLCEETLISFDARMSSRYRIYKRKENKAKLLWNLFFDIFAHKENAFRFTLSYTVAQQGSASLFSQKEEEEEVENMP